MEQLIFDTSFKLLDKPNKKWLLSNNFHYNKLLSDKETEVYTYRFPVLKYERLTVLECEFRVILGENRVNVDVYDYNTNNKYAPFYYTEYGNFNTVLKNIYTEITNKMQKFGIKNTGCWEVKCNEK